MNKLLAEFFGTFWLVLGGCGSAVLAAAFPDVGIGLVGVSLAFGLTVLTMAYAVGHVSGGHFNPAVSLGLTVAGRFAAKDLAPYIVAQVLGGIVAGGVLYVIASGQAGFDVAAGFASNGFGEHSPGQYSLLAALVTEIVMTAMFLVIILGATDGRAPAGFAPIAIGLALDADPPDQHSRDQHVRESRAQHGRRRVRRWLGGHPALAVLAGAARGRSSRRSDLSRDRWPRQVN